MTYSELQAEGELIETAAEGTVQLWKHNGDEYVVLSDNTVITRVEDNKHGPEEAFFPIMN